LTIEPYFLFQPNLEFTKIARGDASSRAFGASADASTQADSIASQAPAGSKAFATFEMKDVYGHDYSTVRDLKLEDCQAMCSTGERCKAYTYDKWNHICILKDGVGPLRVEPKSVAGVLSTEPTTLSSGSESIQMHKSKRFPNPGYQRLAEATSDNCAKVCLADKHCAAFNFEVKERFCVLIAQPDEYSDSNMTDIGIKEQLP
jgi:hypothetical protein